MRLPLTLPLVMAVCLALALPPVAAAQQKVTLREAIDLAQKQSLGARAASSAREAARERDHGFNARLFPQVSLTGELPSYSRSIVRVRGDSGDRAVPFQVQSSTLGLTVEQQLPFSGGRLAVTSGLSQLQSPAEPNGRSWSSTPLFITLQQELRRPNSLRWDAREQDLRIDGAERSFLDAREQIAQETAAAFFDVYRARAALDNATSNVAVNDTLYTLNKGRLEVGKIAENDLLSSELALLRARNAADGARLEYDRAMAALRLALNLAPDVPLEIEVTNEIPAVNADTTVAIAQAVRNSAQMKELELQDLQARRRVTEARLLGGIGGTITASYGFNQTAGVIDSVYRDLLSARQFTLGVQIPLWRWGAHGADVQAARAEQDRVAAISERSRRQLVLDAKFAALQLDQAARQLAIAAKADTVANKRFEVAKNRYVIGKIDFTELNLAQNEKDQALQSYLFALRGYWVAYYGLRRTTLYDFVEGRAIR